MYLYKITCHIANIMKNILVFVFISKKPYNIYKIFK